MKLDTVRRKIRTKYRQRGSWRKLAKDYNKVSWIVLWRLANDMDYEPKGAAIREELDLSPYRKRLPAPVCVKCGVVHVSQKCPANRRWRDLFDMPGKGLRGKLGNREEVRK